MKRTWSFLLALLSAIPLLAQWQNDPLQNTPVCTAAGEQKIPLMFATEDGGVILGWPDDRNGNGDVYAQKLDSLGFPQWTTDGVAACAQSDDQYLPVICTDGAGGAYLAWQDLRNPDPKVYLQRIRANGTTAWTTNGIAVANSTGRQSAPAIAPDGVHGLWIAFRDDRNSAYEDDIYVQRIDSGGNHLFGLGGALVCSATERQSEPFIAAMDTSYAIVTWNDPRQNNQGHSQIFVQKIDGAGNSLWTNNGIALNGLLESNEAAVAAPDHHGGAYVAWQKNVQGAQFMNAAVYAQHLDATGTETWTSGGVLLGTDVNSMAYDPLVYFDPAGAGHLFATWYNVDWQLINGVHLRAQKLDTAGNQLWANNGADVLRTLHSSGAMQEPRTFFALAEQVHSIHVGNDNPTVATQYYIYLQKLDSGGTPVFSQNFSIAGAHYLNEHPVVVMTTSARYVIAWGDERNFSHRDVYVECVLPNGELCPKSPVGVEDKQETGLVLVPNPVNGGEIVRVEWKKRNAEARAVRVMDLQGKVMLERRTVGDYMELPVFPRGLYLVEVEGVGVKKMVVQ